MDLTNRQKKPDKLSLKGSVIALVASLGISTGAVQAGELLFDFNTNLVSGTPSIFLFGDSGQSATISNLDGFNTTITLSSDGFYDLSLPLGSAQSGTGVRNTGFKVVSPDPIAGYFVNRAGASTDMTYVMDRDALGTNYVIASQGGGFGEGSQAMIHAAEDNTTVTFTPKGGFSY